MIYLQVVCFSVCFYVHFYLNFSILKFEMASFCLFRLGLQMWNHGEIRRGYRFLQTQFHFSVETGSPPEDDILFRAETYNYRSHRLHCNLPQNKTHSYASQPIVDPYTFSRREIAPGRVQVQRKKCGVSQHPRSVSFAV